eukprot:768781-Hanusia_phi.AAC.24
MKDSLFLISVVLLAAIFAHAESRVLVSTSIDYKVKDVRLPGKISDITLGFASKKTIHENDQIVWNVPGFGGLPKSGQIDAGWMFEWTTDGRLTLTARKSINAGERVGVTLKSSWKISTPKKGIDQTLGKEFMVSFHSKQEPDLTSESYPVENWTGIAVLGCHSVNIHSSDGFCAGDYQVKMCAKSQDAVRTYVRQQKFTEASSCEASLTSSCKAIGVADAVGYLSLSSASAMEKQMLCCSESPSSAIVGIDNLATCNVDSECSSVDATIPGSGMQDAQLSSNPGISQQIPMCCNYCEEFYGTMGCSTSTGQVLGNDNMRIKDYCRSTLGCSNEFPCYGRSVRSKGLQLKTCSGDCEHHLNMSIVNGHGIYLKKKHIPSEQEARRMKVTRLHKPSIPIPSAAFVSSPVLKFHPAGLNFTGAVTLQIAVDMDEDVKFSNNEKLMIHKAVGSTWKPVAGAKVVMVKLGNGKNRAVVTSPITGFSEYAVLRSTAIAVAPVKKEATSAGKEAYICIPIAGFLLLMILVVVFLPAIHREPPYVPPPTMPRPQPMAPRVMAPPSPPKQQMKAPPPPALPLPKPLYEQAAEPVRFHHGAPIKHFGPVIWNSEEIDWWTQEQAKQEYKFPKMPAFTDESGTGNTHNSSGQ